MLMVLFLAWFPPGAAELARTPADPPASVELTGASETPLINLHGVPAVEVHLNGRGPYRFVLDWGANLLAVSPRVARELSLRSTGTDPLGNDVVPLDSLHVGASTFKGLAAAVDPFLDGKDEDGVLGVNVYAGVLTTMDGPGRRLRLERGSLPPPDGKEILPLVGPSGAEPQVSLEIAGRREDALVDTAAAAGIVIPAARAADFTIVDAGPATASGPGPQAPAGPAREGTLAADVKLGTHVLHRPRVRVADRRRLILGQGLLHCFTVTLDQANRRIRFVWTDKDCSL